jgi:hypothetical protein
MSKDQRMDNLTMIKLLSIGVVLLPSLGCSRERARANDSIADYTSPSVGADKGKSMKALGADETRALQGDVVAANRVVSYYILRTTEFSHDKKMRWYKVASDEGSPYAMEAMALEEFYAGYAGHCDSAKLWIRRAIENTKDEYLKKIRMDVRDEIDQDRDKLCEIRPK